MQNITSAAQLGNRIGFTNEEFFKFAKQADLTGNILQQYKDYTANATQSTSQFAASLANIAVNAGAVLAINLAIQAGLLAWDAINVTVEEQEAKVNSLQTAYQNLQSEYEQLAGKQDLTDAEQKRLSYLERRLELDERILEAEKSQLFEEKTGSKFTDLFDPDNLETQYKKEMLGTAGEWNLLSGFAQNRDGYAYLSGLYRDKMDEVHAFQKEIDKWTSYRDKMPEGSGAWNIYQEKADSALKRQTGAMQKLSDMEDQLTINLGKYADNIEYLEEHLASGDLTDSQTKTAREQLAKWKSLYEYTRLMIDSTRKLNGTYQETRTVLQQIDKTYGGGYSDGTAADLNRTQEQKNFRVFSHSLNTDDQEIVNSDAFSQALEQIREKADGAELSVRNYEEALAAAKGTQDELALSGEAAAGASADFTDASLNSMYSLLNEGQAAGITREMIYQLAAAEIAYNTTGLSTEEKISQLKGLADAYGDTAASALAASAANRVANGHGDYETILSDMMAVIERKTGDFQIEFDPIIPRNVGPSSAAAKTETNALSSLNSEMDKLQSSYKSLCDIRDTYNQNGKITVDQYQELTNMGFTLLSQLVDENGQLGLNASAFERLSQAKPEEMQRYNPHLSCKSMRTMIV